MTSLSVWLFSPYCAILIGYWASCRSEQSTQLVDVGCWPRVGEHRGHEHAGNKVEGQGILIRLGTRMGHGGTVQDWGNQPGPVLRQGAESKKASMAR